MAKKKRVTSGTSTAKWSDSQQISLLAWLDHTLNHDDLDFNDTVVAHLEFAFEIPQVDAKLKSLWDRLGPNDGTSWRNDIFSCGSSCLSDGLHDDAKKAIGISVQCLEDGYIASQMLTPTRQLRKRARSSPVSVTRRATPTHMRAFKAESTETPRLTKRRFQRESLTPSTLRKESEIPRSSPREANVPSKRQKKNSTKNLVKYLGPSSRKHHLSSHIQKNRKSAHRRSISKTIITDSEETFSETENRGDGQLENLVQQDSHVEQPKDYKYKASTSSDSVGEKKEDQICCVCGAGERTKKPQNWIQCDNCMIWQHTRCVDYKSAGLGLSEKYSCEKCDAGMEAKQVNLFDKGLTLHSVAEEMNDNLNTTCNQTGGNLGTSSEERLPPQLNLGWESAKDEIKFLQEQLKQMDSDLQESVASAEAQERECWSLREAQRQRDMETGWPVEETIQKYNGLKKRLQADIQKRDKLNKFSGLIGNSRQWFGRIELQHGFEDVYSQSQQILCWNDGDKLPFLPTLDSFGKLRELVYGCLALDSELVEDSEVAMNTLSKLTPQAIVRGLTTWALRAWVFEQDFPRFEKCESGILAAYRNILRIQDGAIVLRNLDLAATESLVKGDHLQQEVIPQKAEALAILLSQTLEPLFTDRLESTIDRAWDGFATWGDPSEEWRERRDRLTKMFEVALKVKADSFLNIETYEMVIYPPGTKFDEKTMRVETAEGMLDTVNAHAGRVVELCIQAAVFAYARQPLMNDDPVSEAVISSINFFRKESKDRLAISPRVKAVVLLKGAPMEGTRR